MQVCCHPKTQYRTSNAVLRELFPPRRKAFWVNRISGLILFRRSAAGTVPSGQSALCSNAWGIFFQVRNESEIFNPKVTRYLSFGKLRLSFSLVGRFNSTNYYKKHLNHQTISTFTIISWPRKVQDQCEFFSRYLGNGVFVRLNFKWLRFSQKIKISCQVNFLIMHLKFNLQREYLHPWKLSCKTRTYNHYAKLLFPV